LSRGRKLLRNRLKVGYAGGGHVPDRARDKEVIESGRHWPNDRILA
jgi:hypothetical protein